MVAKVITDTKQDTLIGHVRERVLPATAFFTDEAYAYDPLSGLGYPHKCVHHAAKVYVDAMFT